jgi:hypothetical protein
MIRGCMRDRRLQPAHRVWHQKWHLIGAEGTASSRAIFPSGVRHPSPAFLVSEPRLACQTSVGTDPKDCVTGSLANHAHREHIDAAALPAAHQPLDKNFVRVLSENLATLLDTHRIEKYPWALRTKVDYQVEVDVQRFETTSEGQTQLIASWIIRGGLGGKILYASETTTGAPAGTDEASASAALSSDLTALSKEIASRVTEIDQHRSPNNADSNSAATL